MVINTISEAKAQLSALIERIQKGEEVIIKKAGKPIAVLIAYKDYTGERRPGALKGKITINADFDELPGDIAEAFGIETP